MSEECDRSSGQESITVRYQPVLGTSLAYHKYIIYEDAAGNKMLAHVMPMMKSDVPVPSGEPAIRMKGIVKAMTEPEDAQWLADRKDNHSEVIIRGDDLSEKFKSIEETIKSLHGRPYYVMGPNSNSAVDTALERAGLCEPLDDDGEEGGSDQNPGEKNAPGSGKILPDDYTPPMPLGPPGPPGPTRGLPTPLALDNLRDPPVTPLVLDLDGDGIELTTLSFQ